MAWLAPGVVFTGIAAIVWLDADSCDSGGCAVGMAIAMFALLIAWPVAAVICSRVAMWLADRRRLSVFNFVAIVFALGSLPFIPFVFVALWRQFFLSEAVILLAVAFAVSATIAMLWWILKFGFALVVSDRGMTPDKSLERTRER